MGTTNGWARRAWVPVIAQVTAILALGAVLVVAGVLRAAHDLPMAIALVTMGLAIQPEAVLRVRRAERRRRQMEPSTASADELSRRRAAAAHVDDELVAA